MRSVSELKNPSRHTYKNNNKGSFLSLLWFTQVFGQIKTKLTNINSF